MNLVATLSDLVYQCSAMEGSVWHRPAYLKYLTSMSQRICRRQWFFMFSRMPTYNRGETLQFDECFHITFFLLHWLSHINDLLPGEIFLSSYCSVILSNYFPELNNKRHRNIHLLLSSQNEIALVPTKHEIRWISTTHFISFGVKKVQHIFL